MKDDLEKLTGKLIRGKISGTVYDLIKDTKYKEDLLDYINYCSSETLKEKLKEVQHDYKSKQHKSSMEECSERHSLKEWFS